MSIVFEPPLVPPPAAAALLELLLLLPHALSATIEPKTRPPRIALPRTLIYVPPLVGPGFSVTPVAGRLVAAPDTSKLDDRRSLRPSTNRN